MRRRALVWIFTALVLILAGCTGATDPVPEGYTVLIDGTPGIFDQRIYYYGAAVGAIEATHTRPDGVTRLTVSLAPAFASEIGNNLAFYVSAGRLEATKLQNIGQPLKKGDLLCGFNSKAAWQWFKVRTLFHDRISSVQKRARALNGRAG